MGTKYHHEKVNPMEYLFGPRSANYKVWQLMREGIRSNSPGSQKIDMNLVRLAHNEAVHVMASEDRSTYPFHKDFTDYAFGMQDLKRTILVVEGTLIGGLGHRTMIGVDLGTNPHEVFQGRGFKGTVDEFVTKKWMRDYLWRLGESTDGVEGIRVWSSKFFYFMDGDLTIFRHQGTGQIDMHSLLPLVVDTSGITHIGLDPYKQPQSAGERQDFKAKYADQAPLFTSYRLKRTLRDKVMKILAKDNMVEEDMITDAVAHRFVAASELVVRDLEQRLLEIPKNKDRKDRRIGSTELKWVKVKNDFYTNPKPLGETGYKYRSLHLIMEVKTGGHEPCVRGIQVVDKNQHFANELDPDSLLRRPEYNKKKERVGANIPKHYNEVISKIFQSTPLTVWYDG